VGRALANLKMPNPIEEAYSPDQGVGAEQHVRHLLELKAKADGRVRKLCASEKADASAAKAAVGTSIKSSNGHYRRTYDPFHNQFKEIYWAQVTAAKGCVASLAQIVDYTAN
jgi:hypothetical protein